MFNYKLKKDNFIGNRIIFYNGFYHLIKYQIGNAYICDNKLLGIHIFIGDKAYNYEFK
jgi:hypothetical protein